MKPVILLLGEDLAFIFWLGRLLDEAGYEALPAKSVPDARHLLGTLDLLPDAVIVDLSLPGDSELFADLRRKQRSVKIIALVKEAHSPIHPQFDWQFPKPTDQTQKVEFFRQIHSILAAQALSHRSGTPPAPPKTLGASGRRNPGFK